MSIFVQQFLELLAVSFFAGAIGSLMGLGGGMIIVPVMTLFFHIDFSAAAGASIVAIIATSSGSAVAYVRNHLANIRVGIFLETATTTGAICGALLSGLFPPALLFVAFALILGYSLVPTGEKILAELQGRKPDRDPAPIGEGKGFSAALRLDGAYFDEALGRVVRYRLRRLSLGAGIMYLAGLASGLLGIGSGAFKVLAMDGVMSMPLKSSTATSNFMIGVTAAASAGIYFSRGDIDPLLAAPVALGVLGGSILGARILPRMSGLILRLLFFLVIAVISVQMLLRGLGQPG
jgi:hypothetical protein